VISDVARREAIGSASSKSSTAFLLRARRNVETMFFWRLAHPHRLDLVVAHDQERRPSVCAIASTQILPVPGAPAKLKAMPGWSGDAAQPRC
jgi:hypothetical protein